MFVIPILTNDFVGITKLFVLSGEEGRANYLFLFRCWLWNGMAALAERLKGLVEATVPRIGITPIEHTH